MFTKFFPLLSLLLMTSVVAAATPTFDHPLTLTELVDIGLENHPSTKQTWWNARRAAAAVGNAKSAYYPTLDLEVIAQHGRDFKFINGPNTNYTLVGADLVLSMMLFDFGERSANMEAAKMSLLAANWQADWTIQKVMVNILENAYSTLHAQEAFCATQRSLEDAEKVHYTAQELNRAGLSPVTDVYTSLATLSHMKMELAQLNALYEIQKGKLAASLGLPATVDVELASLEPIQLPQMQQIDDLVSLALRQRADLMAKQARLSESLSNQAKIRAAYKPKVALNARGGANHMIHDKTSGGQYAITLNLNVPLFDGFETMYQNRMAYADTNISREELAELQLTISLEVLTYSRMLEAAQEMLPHAENSLLNSIKAYEGVLDRYKAGKQSIAEVSNAQQQLAASRIQYSDVKTRWLVSVANLAYATGALTPYMETPCTNN